MREELPVYSFGPFRLEVRERRLLRDGEHVPLLGKAFDTLVALVEGAGTLQRQHVLMDRLWPDVSVEQNNLQQAISLVRRALADAPGVEIETVRGQGYRLHARVSRISETAPARPQAVTASAVAAALPPGRTAQRTHFCAAHDGARIAYAQLGTGPTIVKAANWLSHLELDWDGPVWPHWLERLSRGRCLVRYDARGNGLSDWSPPSIQWPDFIADLGTVFDAAGVTRAPVLGISQGASVAVAFAARHPERVSGLILVAGCARGWRVKASAKLRERMEALMVLMRQGWGGEHPAFRQIFTSSFFPRAAAAETDWFNELQRQTASPDNAAAMLSALGDVDVRGQLSAVRVPTLVVHPRGDMIVPMKDGIELAAGIAGARFVPLDTDNHILLADDPAWAHFDAVLEQFLRETGI
jgi:pimeloyl-ACP methyl ester carboxylesterase/DNA-binding winged helix-turn-helix (wHTH) protein